MPGPAWQEMIKTEGRSDLYVQQNTWDPTACHCIPSTGWHTHPGPSFVIVTKGTVTAYDGDDPTCSPHVYTANTANNSFVDPGDGHVHIIRDESGAVAQTVAVQLIAARARHADRTQRIRATARSETSEVQAELAGTIGHGEILAVTVSAPSHRSAARHL